MFVADLRRPSGVGSYCRTCHSAYSRARKYGVTAEDIQVLYEAQEGRCASCDGQLKLGKGTATHVDHCHTTGAVRGLLCRNCNLALGLLNEDSQRIHSLAHYIEHHKAAA